LLGVADWNYGVGFSPFAIDNNYFPTPGLISIEFCTVHEDIRKRPTAASIVCNRIQVLAWPVDNDPFKAICATEIRSSLLWVIEWPDGKLWEPNIGFYYDLEGAKAEALRRAQESWDDDRDTDDDESPPTTSRRSATTDGADRRPRLSGV